ncbi:MAG: hypothetical protein V4668_01165 [Patescibacteria group bacterium]
MNVMTYLVGILSGDKLFKRVISFVFLFLILSTIFLTSFANVLAQSGPAGGVPGVDRPYRPGDPGYVPPPATGGPTTPGSPTSPGTDTGGPGGGGAPTETTVIENQAETPVGEIDNMALRMLHAVFVEGLGWVLGIFGYFFDFAIEHFIIGFGDKYLNSNLGSTIESLWSTVRDIFNLTFIFGLVYIGFKMILDSSDSSARRMLVYLIGAALLVNFSLFVTKFIIDLSNITAFQIYRAFASDSAVGGFSLTTAFKDMMGVNDILAVQYDSVEYVGFRYIFGIAIVFLVMSYVFLAGAIMITIRFVVLCIYMVFSPFMFLGWVFPSMQGQSARYWKGFLNQAFFAPAFLFMIYLSYRVAFSYGETRRSWQHVFNNGTGASASSTPDTIAYFALVMVFLVASLMVARHMGAYGATVAISAGNNLRGRAQTAIGAGTVGMAARVGRGTIGAGAYALKENDRFKSIASKTGRFGKGMYNATAGVADSSFDARQVGGIGKSLGIGEGKKGGFVSRIKETEKSDKAFMDAIGKTDDIDVAKAVNASQSVIAAKEASAIATTEAEALRTSVQSQTSQYRTTINQLATESTTASKERKQEIANEINAQQVVIKNIEEQNASQIAAAQKRAAEASDKLIKVTNQETARATYKNQLAYIASLKKWQEMQAASISAVSGSGAAGAVAMSGLGLGVLTGGAVLAAAGAGASTYKHNKSVVSSLEKEYGLDGTSKLKSSAESKRLKALAELAAKESGDKK